MGIRTNDSTGAAMPPMDEAYVVGLLRGIAEDMAEAKGSPWMTVRGAARYAHIDERALVSAMNVGELPSYLRPGKPQGQQRRWLYRPEVDEWLRSNPYLSPWREAVA